MCAFAVLVDNVAHVEPDHAVEVGHIYLRHTKNVLVALENRTNVVGRHRHGLADVTRTRVLPMVIWVGGRVIINVCPVQQANELKSGRQ